MLGIMFINMYNFIIENLHINKNKASIIFECNFTVSNLHREGLVLEKKSILILLGHTVITKSGQVSIIKILKIKPIESERVC